MPPVAPDDHRPLASYVLRVHGRPAILRFELHDIRTGERHSFRHAERLLEFLRSQGLATELDPGLRDETPAER